MAHRSLTELAHQSLERMLREGDFAIDATVGNGHDTLFLARNVGIPGKVMGFDIQSQALEFTRRRLEQARLMDRVKLVPAGHQTLERHLPVQWQTRLRVVMFNLGYLPGGDKGIVTRPANTLDGVRQSLELLMSGGVLSVIAYRGHPGGMQECEVVNTCFAALDPKRFSLRIEHPAASNRPGPVLFLVRKGQC